MHIVTDPIGRISEEPEHGMVEAVAVLNENGIHSGPAGFDLAGLAAAIYARGWQYGIDFRNSEFRAEISTATDSQTISPQRGVGSTPEAAMIAALAQALLRETPDER